MRIIDAHSHLGSCRVFGANQTGEELIAAMDDAEIEASVVQPFPGAPSAHETHNQIHELSQRYPNRIVGMASLSPHRARDEYQGEIQRCVEDLGFVAVKVHPIGHAVRPGSEDAHLIFDTASDLGIAVMIHTGPGVPFAEPASWIPMAQQYTDTDVILGHAGAGIYSGPAIVAAQICSNIVLETSWSNPQDIRAAIQTLGADRVLFGSDMTFNTKVEIAKYDSIELSAEQQNLVFHQNSERVYGIGSITR